MSSETKDMVSSVYNWPVLGLKTGVCSLCLPITEKVHYAPSSPQVPAKKELNNPVASAVALIGVHSYGEGGCSQAIILGFVLDFVVVFCFLMFILD